MNDLELKEILKQHEDHLAGNKEVGDFISNKLSSQSISGFYFEGNLQGCVLNETRFECCVFKKVDFRGASIGSLFSCCLFIDCNFNKTSIVKSKFECSKIENSSFIQSEIYSAKLTSSIFTKCDFGLVDLLDPHLEQSTIDGTYKSEDWKPLIRNTSLDQSSIEINLLSNNQLA